MDRFSIALGKELKKKGRNVPAKDFSPSVKSIAPNVKLFLSGERLDCIVLDYSLSACVGPSGVIQNVLSVLAKTPLEILGKEIVGKEIEIRYQPSNFIKFVLIQDVSAMMTADMEGDYHWHVYLSGVLSK